MKTGTALQILIPLVAGGGTCAGVLVAGHPALPAILIACAVLLVTAGLARELTGRTQPAAGPAELRERRRAIQHDTRCLQVLRGLYQGVFEVSAELVGCVEETDLRERVQSVLGRYWRFASLDLLLWERGQWRSVGGTVNEEPPQPDGPTALPAESGGQLLLDLSTAVEGQALLILDDARPQPPLLELARDDQRYMAEVLRGQLALALRRVVLFRQLQELGRSDPLTTTYRRWYGRRRLEELVEDRRVVAIAVLDIDDFKAVNDAHGHEAGDRTLAAVGRRLREECRAGDIVFRDGGEEFVVVMPETGPAGAQGVAERHRSAIAALADLPQAVTVSVGVASCLMDETAEELLARGDAAMYAAKSAGKNRVVIAEEVDGPASSSMIRVMHKPRTEALQRLEPDETEEPQ
ncbi:MAG: diguanylate cyclase [Planctomycetota bacterium]